MERKTLVKSQVTYLRHLRRWEKILCAFVIGVVASTITSGNTDELLDTFVMSFFYGIWLLVCLPELFKRLTAKFIKDSCNVLFYFFFADIFIFGVYRTLRSYLPIFTSDVTFETASQRGYVFLMNGARLLCILACVLKSTPAIASSFQTKDRATPRKSRKSWYK